MGTIDNLKTKLRGMGLEVSGETIREVADSVRARYNNDRYVPSEAWELLERYLTIGGVRRVKAPRPERLAKVRDAEGMRLFIQREYGSDPGSSLDAIAGWIERNKLHYTPIVKFLRQKIAELRRIEAEEVAAQERLAAELSPVPQGLPYFITNYSYQFNRIHWAPVFPDAIFDPRVEPYLMRDYRSGTVKDGAVVDLGPLMPGDAIIAMTDRRTGIGSVAHLPFVGNESETLERIRKRELTSRMSIGGLASWVNDSPEQQAARLAAITTPYEYELARLVREQTRLLPDNTEADLVAALVFAGVGMQDGKEHPAGMVELLVGAAYVMGIPIVDIAIFPPWRAEDPQEHFRFDNRHKIVKAGKRPVATLGGKRDLGQSTVALMEKTMGRMGAMKLDSDARALIDDALVPMAIGLWGRDPGAFTERFRVLFDRLAKTPADQQEKVVLERKEEWGKLAADRVRSFSGVIVEPEWFDASERDPELMAELEAVLRDDEYQSQRPAVSPSGTPVGTPAIAVRPVGR